MVDNCSGLVAFGAPLDASSDQVLDLLEANTGIKTIDLSNIGRANELLNRAAPSWLELPTVKTQVRADLCIA